MGNFRGVFFMGMVRVATWEKIDCGHPYRSLVPFPADFWWPPTNFGGVPTKCWGYTPEKLVGGPGSLVGQI